MVDINSWEEGRWKERLLLSQEPRERRSKFFKKYKWPVVPGEDAVCFWQSEEGKLNHRKMGLAKKE